MMCSCGFGSECPIWCGNGHRNGQCPRYNANNDVVPHQAPRCFYCHDQAPCGDERNYWISYHTAWYHKLWHRLRRMLV
jgi:hypothetical protein